MAPRRAHTQAREDVEKEPSTTNEDASSKQTDSEVNGAADADASGQTQPAMQRAEELVDQIGERIGHYATVFGHGLLRFAARAREEAEDIWAEAQNIRRGQQD
jgi:hypothetical protein